MSPPTLDTTRVIDVLDADVRSEVRRHGVDPQLDVDAVRRMAAAAVRAHDQASLSGVVRPLDEPDSVIDELVARVAGLGPLQRYLDDPTVEEIWINEPQRVFIARDGKHELTTTILTEADVRDLVERMLKTSHRRIDLSSPFVDAMLPSGHRLHVVLDGITRGYSVVNIRKEIKWYLRGKWVVRMRAGIYVRISEDREGAGQGVVRQEKECRELAERKGWPVVNVYRDNDTSATRSKSRPAYEQLLTDLRSGVIDAVIVWDLDRLHRRPIELEHFMHIADAQNVSLASVGGDVDLATSNGRYFARMQGAAAAREVEQSRARIMAKQRQLREQGKPFTGGKRAYGYAADRMTVVEEEAEVIRECAQRVLDGQSMGRITRDLNERGVLTVSQKREIELRARGREAKPGSPWSITSVRTMLTRPRHIGVLTHKGRRVETPGAWEPILDLVTFERVQEVLNNPERSRYLKTNRNKYLLSGIATCGVCGTTMGIGFGSKNAARPTGPYYKCRSRSACVRIDQAALDTLILDRMMATGKAKFEAVSTDDDADEGPLILEIEQIERRRMMLATQLGQDDDVSPEQFQATNTALADRVRVLQREVAETSQRRMRRTTIPYEVMVATWDQWPLDARRQMLRAVIQKLVVHRTGRRGKGIDPDRVEIVWVD